MPLLAVGGVIITPDTPSVLFWGLTVWALAELHRSQDAHWWLAVGLFSGLGLLSKYTNLFVGVGIAFWIALVPANWRWLRSWQLWAGGALACALALPVIFWNVEHDWASFDKQFGRVARGVDTTLSYLVEFAGAYLGLASPLIAILAAWGLWIVLRMAVAERDQARVILAVTIAPLVAYVLLHAVHARVQPNWVAPLYPALAICAAIALERIADPRVMGRVGAAALVVGSCTCMFFARLCTQQISETRPRRCEAGRNSQLRLIACGPKMVRGGSQRPAMPPRVSSPSGSNPQPRSCS
jgi:4-amino-4-deoxy-L-arabinose transferase-like glycosyltransferase